MSILEKLTIRLNNRLKGKQLLILEKSAIYLETLLTSILTNK